MQLPASPVTWHLSPAGAWVARGTRSLKQHIGWAQAESKTKRAISIIWIKPIIARLHRQGRSDQHRFVAGTGYLKKDLVLGLQLKFLVVDSPRGVNQPINLEHGLAVKPTILFNLRLHCHAIPLRLSIVDCGFSDCGS